MDIGSFILEKPMVCGGLKAEAATVIREVEKRPAGRGHLWRDEVNMSPARMAGVFMV